MPKSISKPNDSRKTAKLHPRRSKKNKRRAWTTEEDQIITHLVCIHGTKQWTLIADKLKYEYKFSNRNGKQCRERWHNHLNPDIVKRPWLPDEEKLIFEYHALHGNKWAEIAALLPGRSDNSIKNHFYSTLRKEFRRKHGYQASKEQLHAFDSELKYEILQDIQSIDSTEDADQELLTSSSAFHKAQEVFFAGDPLADLAPPDLPELVPIHDTDMYIQGIPVSIVEEHEENIEYLPSEVFCLPWCSQCVQVILLQL